MQPIETLLQAADVLADVRVHRRLISQQLRRRHLLRPRRPGADVAEDVADRGDHGLWTDAPPDAHAGGGERLRDPVHEDGVPRDLGHRADGDFVPGVPKGQHPVHLIVEEVERLASRAIAAAVLLHDGLADAHDLAGREDGAGGIQGRVQGDQPRGFEQGPQR